MPARYRATIDVKVPGDKLDQFRSAVQRFAPAEFKWRQVDFGHASIVPGSRKLLTEVRVLIDCEEFGADPEEDVEDGGRETVVRALLYVKAPVPADLAVEVTEIPASTGRRQHTRAHI